MTGRDIAWMAGASFAHRGLHDARHPENSLAAVEAALRAGLGVEVDVRVSADGVAVVHHDATLDRTTTGSGPVASRTVRELARLRLWGNGEPMPRLVDVLDLVDGRRGVLLDLKSGPRQGQRAAMARALIAAVAGCRGPVAVASYDPVLLRAVREALPLIAAGQTIGIPAGRRAERALATTLGLPVQRGWLARISAPDFLSVHLAALDQSGVRSQRRSGRPVLAWTVRTAEERHAARALSDGLIVEGLAARPAGAGRQGQHSAVDANADAVLASLLD